MKARFGDIVEIKTSKGLAYALYTHRHTDPPKFGALIRIFDQLFQARPADFTELITTAIRFSTFFPLQAAVNRNLVEIVGNIPIPEYLRPFPIFRRGTFNPRTKKVHAWWLWDGKIKWQIGNLTAEQRKLPILEVWNDTYLIHRIEDGWRPETDNT